MVGRSEIFYWGRSSAGLERQIVDLKVAGSNPVVPASNKKRRFRGAFYLRT